MKVNLEDLYMHCPDATIVVFKEINNNFGMKLRTVDCDLNLLRAEMIGKDIDSDLIGESPARVRRIKKRKVRIAQTEF